MILCCGEALIDMIASPTLSGRGGFVPHSGGAVFNTAIALGRLGAPVGMLTGLSRDMFGQQLLADMAASHVDSSLVLHCDRPTTLAFVRLENGQARYAFFDENSAGRMLNAAQMPGLPAAVTALFFGGISLAVEPAASAYVGVAMTQRADRLVMLDPNIRPGFITDEAGYRARLNRMIGLSHIVKVSDEDLDWLAPGGASVEQPVKALLAIGLQLVIVTKGRDGAQAWHANGAQVSVPGRSVSVVDTVGAGDAFNAGVLACLAENKALTPVALAGLSQDDLRAAIGFGVAVASIAVSRAGADPPWRSELSA